MSCGGCNPLGNTSGSGGDVVGPAGAVDGNLASFDGPTGKLIEDSGISAAALLAALASLGSRVHIASYAGSGSDGPLTAAAGITVLTKPTYYSTVTLTGTAQINCNGWPLYIQVFDASNAPARAIFCTGGDTAATSPNPPAVISTNVGSYLGGNGVGGQAPSAGANPNLNGSPGSAPVSPVVLGGGGLGGSGGAGGNGNGGKTGGVGGAGGTFTLRTFNQGLAPIAPQFTLSGGSGIWQPILGGSGGGGGGSGAGSNGINSGAAGVAGAGGGRLLEVWIGELITSASTPAGVIDSFGGSSAITNGTPPDGGGGGSGGGGGGGITRAFIGKRTGPVVANLVCANGGFGGLGGPAAGGGTAGGGGQAGGGGEVLCANLSTGVVSYKGFQAAGGPLGVGRNGGVPTTWGVNV